MSEETTSTPDVVEVDAETSTGVEIKAAIRFPKGAAAGRDDVEGHEFKEEDQLERMAWVNIGCCT